MKRLSLNSWRVAKLLSLFLLSTAAYYYLDFFLESLVDGQWEDVDGFTRIVIPDTFIYKAIVDGSDVFTSIILSGVKNTIGPSLLWVAADFDWAVMLFINVGFVYFIIYYMEGLAKQYQISQGRIQVAIVLFLFLPMTAYYTLGALKELPMMLFLLMVVYYFNLKHFKTAIAIAALLVLFRYQLVVLIILFLLLLMIFRKKTLRASLVFLFFLSAVYPAMSFIQMLSLDVTEAFREAYGKSGSIGAQVEFLRNNIYILSALGVLIRVFQSLFEPIITFFGNFSFYEDGLFSIYRFVQFFSVVMITPYIYLFLANLKFIVLARTKIENDVQAVFSLLLVSIILVGGFSFIHHRYLIPFFPLIIIASLISRERMQGKYLDKVNVGVRPRFK